MDYDINALLFKLGITELSEKQSMRWHYLDGANPNINGMAEARFENAGHRLIVDLVHARGDIENDEGVIQKQDLQSLRLEARRIGDSEIFRITKIAFDGEDYEADSPAMIELCCGVFYARALEISEIMTKQRFQSTDAAISSAEDRVLNKNSMRREVTQKAFETADNLMGVIVPFKPRKDAPLQRF